MKHRLYLFTCFTSIAIFLCSFMNAINSDEVYSKGEIKYTIGMKAFGGIIFYLDKVLFSYEIYYKLFISLSDFSYILPYF